MKELTCIVRIGTEEAGRMFSRIFRFSLCGVLYTKLVKEAEDAIQPLEIVAFWSIGKFLAMTRIKLSEYNQLDEEGKAAQLAELSRARQQPLNGQIEYLNEKISEYETTYEMSSEAMVEAVKNRTMKETADICSWIMLVNVRNELSR